MNRQKLATVGCIVLSIVFSLSIGLFIHFKIFWPNVCDNYEKTLNYPEALYEEYQKEAEEMIASNEFSCQHPVKTETYFENGKITLVLKIGEFNKDKVYSNYLTATVKNFGTEDEQITFERSRKSAEEAYKSAENYRNLMGLFTVIFIGILIIFTAYLIENSIKRCYSKVFYPMLNIVIYIGIFTLILHFLLK